MFQLIRAGIGFADPQDREHFSQAPERKFRIRPALQREASEFGHEKAPSTYWAIVRRGPALGALAEFWVLQVPGSGFGPCVDVIVRELNELSDDCLGTIIEHFERELNRGKSSELQPED